MDNSEKTEALAAVGMMLQAFPSAQSSITADSPKVYLFAVEEFPLEALKRACRAIVRGEVKDLKADFPPAAPKLAQIVKEFEGELRVEQYEAARLFVEQGSVMWEKMKLLRNDRGLVTTVRTQPDGRRATGWFFLREEVAKADMLALPPHLAEWEQAAMRDRVKALGYAVGDSDGDKDAA